MATKRGRVVANSKLNPRQQRFVEEYLVDLNATKAAERAGYSEKTANPQAARLLAKASIQAAVAVGMEKRSRRVEITQDRVLFELACIGFANMQDFMEVTAEGEEALKKVSALDRQHAAAIAEFTVDKDGKSKLKLADKRASLVDIGRHLGMFPSNVQVTGKDGKDLIPRLDLSDRVELGKALAFTLAFAAHNTPAENTEPKQE